MEQLVVILILAAIAVANKLLKKSAESGGSIQKEGEDIPKPPLAYRPAVQRQPESDEERMRKFMEALGVPPSSPPPRRITRPVRPAQTPRSSQAAPLPPVRPRNPVQAPPPLSQPAPIQTAVPPAEPETSFPEPALVTAPPVEQAPAGIPAALKTGTPALYSPSNIRALLRNRDSLRNAILLREIIDSPKGLQAYP